MSRLFITARHLGRIAAGLATKARSAVEDATTDAAPRSAEPAAAPPASATPSAKPAAAAPANGPPRHRRYLSDRAGSTETYLQAARDYVAAKPEGEHAWLYCKPYERGPGNAAFYTEMYQVLNLLRAMDIPFRGRVLEVGSGPGWVSEILVALGFELHGLEPSADMIAIARERVAAAIAHWHLADPPPYEFHCQTLEANSLPSESFDAIVFHAALHHVIDEDAGLAQCFRLLRPGGVLGVCEGAWEPGNRLLEAALDEEMARFGTLENPFTREYLDWLLARHGFTDVRRYHAINALVPEDRGSATIESLAEAPARGSNTLTAVKPGGSTPTTRDHSARTAAAIRVLEVERQPGTNEVRARVRLENNGETTWLAEPAATGWVSVAVRTEPLGGAGARELQRHRLPGRVQPGEVIELDLWLVLPDDHRRATWHVDLVNEGLYWFSTRGTTTVPIAFPDDAG